MPLMTKIALYIVAVLVDFVFIAIGLYLCYDLKRPAEGCFLIILASIFTIIEAITLKFIIFTV